jgi:hypothetical protein
MQIQIALNPTKVETQLFYENMTRHVTKIRRQRF